MEKFKKGDRVRALKDVGRGARIECLKDQIFTVEGVGTLNNIWFRNDFRGTFNGVDFELYETKEGVKPNTEPNYEIY